MRNELNLKDRMETENELQRLTRCVDKKELPYSHHLAHLSCVAYTSINGTNADEKSPRSIYPRSVSRLIYRILREFYGLYASRTRGRWEEMPRVAERAPEGWKAAHRRGGAQMKVIAVIEDPDELGRLRA